MLSTIAGQNQAEFMTNWMCKLVLFAGVKYSTMKRIGLLYFQRYQPPLPPPDRKIMESIDRPAKTNQISALQCDEDDLKSIDRGEIYQEFKKWAGS